AISSINAGTGSLNVTWNDLNNGETGYVVSAYPGATCGVGTPITANAPANPTFPFQISGLTNGSQYCVNVYAVYPGGSGNPSAGVLATPGAAQVYQTITVNRPTGVLAISQRCAAVPGTEFGPFDTRLPDFQDGGRTGDFDPTNSVVPYNTDPLAP